MKVLITGVAGFLGTHVAELFREKGWDVVGIDNLNSFELNRTDFNVEDARSHNLNFLEYIGVEFMKEDCRNVVSAQFEGVDFIIHCAAQPAMTIAIENPVYDFDNNVASVVNMLNIAKNLKVPFVNCSSVHVYGNSGNDYLKEEPTRFASAPFETDEKAPILNGELTPLHVSKRCTELYTQAYSETYGIRAATFRFTGMYGERQFGGMDHGWVANFAIRTIKQRDITIFGTDKQVRDILYAKDAAKAFYLWFENGKSEIYNIGGGIENSISLGECLEEIREQTGIPQAVKILLKRKGDMWYFVCDYKKAQVDFGWAPETSPKDGIKKLNKWIFDNHEIL